jgi:hypothetical protein
MNRSFLAFALALPMALAPLAHAQDAGGLPVVHQGALVLRQYVPKNVPTADLFQVGQRLWARSFIVDDLGGSAKEPVFNMWVLGSVIVIYDTSDQAQRVLSGLAELDQPAPGMPAADAKLLTFEYTPRFVPGEFLIRALDSFERNIMVNDGRGGVRPVENMSFVGQTGVIVVRETEANVAEIRGLLERIDRPEAQVVLTCWVVQALHQEGGEAGAGLPKDLVTNLQRLLPGHSFRKSGLALLQSSCAPGRDVSMRIQGQGELGFDMRFKPVAYDASSGSLTVTDCRVDRDVYQDTFGQFGSVRTFAGSKNLFNTNTIFRGGEYTVLGASGEVPTLLVIRIAPAGK